MRKIFLSVVLTTILLQSGLAQTINFQISSFNETPAEFKFLLLPNSEISKNDTINEKIVDLAEPMLLDSVIEKRKQHHKVFFVGWLIHAFGGYNWRAVSMDKQKFVGTVKHDGRSGKVEYSEYDIKFHLQFHLQKYFDKICKSCDMQRRIHRQDIRPSHHTDYSKEPFVRTERNLNPLLYDLGAELTPPIPFIPQLNYLFFPSIPGGGGLREHPNFGTSHPTMGFYGVSCLDCNHNCHPELHPYEWVWWLKATDDDNSFDKTWLVGLFHESSKRFRNWSVNPMTGSIKIPFAVKMSGSEAGNILIDHLVFNTFENEELKKMELPTKMLGTMEKSFVVHFVDGNDLVWTTSIIFNSILNTEGLKYWFSDLNYDRQNGILSGYFQLATSVEDLYTTKITFQKSP